MTKKTEIVRAPRAEIAQTSDWAEIDEMVDLMLSEKAASTAKTYAEDYRNFARWAGAASPPEALGKLLENGPGPANRIVLAYKAHLKTCKRTGRNGVVKEGYAVATVNRRLQALRSFVQTARMFGRVNWGLDVRGDAVTPYRDTRGPGQEAIGKMLEVLEARKVSSRPGVSADVNRATALRDTAIIRLMYDNGLRRIEILRIDLPDDLDRPGARIQILGKKRADREWLTLAPKTLAVIDAWIEERGEDAGPMFCALRGTSRGQRLTDRSLTRLITAIGKAAGVRVSPHGLRHTSITAALDASGGDLRATAKFSRHKNWRDIQHYDDARDDFAGDIAKKISEDV